MKYILRLSGIAAVTLFSLLMIFISGIDNDQENPTFKKLLSLPYILEERFYDYRMLKTIDKDFMDDTIVLADIDDASVQEIGRFPWDRETWIQFLKKIEVFGGSIVAFDVLFPEEERFCAVPGKKNISPDKRLAKAIQDFQKSDDRKVILAYTLAGVESDALPEIPAELLNSMINDKIDGKRNLGPRFVSKANYPIEELLKIEPYLGFINQGESLDGIFRSSPILSSVDSVMVPSLALAAYKEYTQDFDLFVHVDTEGGATLNTQLGKLPINFLGESKIRYKGGVENFDRISIADILNAPNDSEEMKSRLEDKIIFVGSSTTGAHDLRHTPLDSQLPGVYIHMNVAHQLLNGYFYKPLQESMDMTLMILFGGALFLALIQFFNLTTLDLAGSVLLIAGLFIADIKYFTPEGYYIKLFFPLFNFFAITAWLTALRFYNTNREKKQIRGTFSRYVAPAIVNQMLEHPEKLKVGGDTMNITCLFSDVRDFTSISEKLSPEELSYCLNRYMGEMTDIVFATDGTLDKYIGDAIVAYWGAPMPLENHPYHAIRGSLQMLEALPAINKEFIEQGYPEYKVGIGLNTGNCSVGNMGSDTIFSYTALGDNMNLGARLESLCKFYGAQLLISDNTKEALTPEQHAEFTFRHVDTARVKGKNTPVKIYEVLHSWHHLAGQEQALADHHKAYSLYMEGKFSEAEPIFREYAEKFPADKTFPRYAEICRNNIENPPQDWDGVTTHDSK